MDDFTQRKLKAKAIKITSLYQEELIPTGKTLKGRCPFHRDTGNPNFMIYPETNSFHCFRCGFGGDSITYMMKLKNLTFTEAIRELLK